MPVCYEPQQHRRQLSYVRLEQLRAVWGACKRKLLTPPSLCASGSEPSLCAHL